MKMVRPILGFCLFRPSRYPSPTRRRKRAQVPSTDPCPWMRILIPA